MKDYVTKILRYIIQNSRQKDIIKAQKELELRYEGFKTVKPDITLYYKRPIQGSTEALPSVPILLVEVKNLEDTKNESLLNHVPQILEQLRSACCVYGLTQCFGVLTNYKDWYFLVYDMAQEVRLFQQLQGTRESIF